MIPQSSIAWDNLLYTLILIGLLVGLSYWYRYWQTFKSNGRSLSRITPLRLRSISTIKI